MTLRQQDPLPAFEREPDVWYAYRDGYELRHVATTPDTSTRLSEI